MMIRLTTFPHIEIGSEVFYFDPVRTGKLEVKESVVYGVFVHKDEGEVYYFVEEKECPAYAVATTKEEIDEKLKKFSEYREILAEADKTIKEKFRALRSGYIFEEYSAEARATQKAETIQKEEIKRIK